MAKAIVYVAITCGAALVSFIWYLLDRPPALLVVAASALAAGIAIPVLARKDFQFVGIPGWIEHLFALGALGMAVNAGLKRSEHWMWGAILILIIPSVRISLVTLKAYQRPLKLKVTIGICLAALFGLNIFLGIRHSHWLGETSVALVKTWFPDATAPVQRTPPPGGPPAGPKPPPPPPPLDPAAPFAVVAGRSLTREMVEYQLFIDSVVTGRSDRNDAIAALLQAYMARAILDRKFKSFDPAMLKDENEWLLNRTRDQKLVLRIRSHKTDDLFLDVYVGANGLYRRKLKEIFDRFKEQELKDRSAEVLAEVRRADGVERPGPKLDGILKAECRYSFRKRDFIGKFDIEASAQEKPDPKDSLAPKLAALKVNATLPEILKGDQNALIVRRIPDDFKGPLYETYRVAEDAVFSAWFKRQCKDLSIEIPDPELRRAMIELARDVSHTIRTK